MSKSEKLPKYLHYLQRWSINNRLNMAFKNKRGRWVKYEDAAREIRRLKLEISRIAIL